MSAAATTTATNTFTLLYWNVKYFGTSSSDLEQRVDDLVGIVRRTNPYLIVLVELTSTASTVVLKVQKMLVNKANKAYTFKLVNAGGGNDEHFACFYDPDFGISPPGIELLDYKVGGGTRKVGKVALSKPPLQKPCDVFVAHPSPCKFTNRVALKEAELLVKSSGTSILVGDLNSTTWDPDNKDSQATSIAATHQGRSGLKQIDGAVFNDLDCVVEKSSRVTSSANLSDHSWLLFTITL